MELQFQHQNYTFFLYIHLWNINMFFCKTFEQNKPNLTNIVVVQELSSDWRRVGLQVTNIFLNDYSDEYFLYSSIHRFDQEWKCKSQFPESPRWRLQIAFFLSGQQSKTLRYSVYYHVRQKKSSKSSELTSWDQLTFTIFAWQMTQSSCLLINQLIVSAL